MKCLIAGCVSEATEKCPLPYQPPGKPTVCKAHADGLGLRRERDEKDPPSGVLILEDGVHEDSPEERALMDRGIQASQDMGEQEEDGG